MRMLIRTVLVSSMTVSKGSCPSISSTKSAIYSFMKPSPLFSWHLCSEILCNTRQVCCRNMLQWVLMMPLPIVSLNLYIDSFLYSHYVIYIYFSRHALALVWFPECIYRYLQVFTGQENYLKHSCQAGNV